MLEPLTQSLANSGTAMVSILIPAFNAGPWIRQCVDSALAQTYPVKEVLIVDDGSTDDTLDILHSYGTRVRVMDGPHAGGNFARNRLLELASGEWLQYLDADDYLLPHKVASQMRRVTDTPDLDMVYSPVILREEKAGTEKVLAMNDDTDLPLHYIRWSGLNTNGFLWRRSSLLTVGGWKNDQPTCQEHELLLRLMEAGQHNFSLVNRPGAVYRINHTTSVSSKNPLQTLQLQMDLLDRLQEYLTRHKLLTRRHRKAFYSKRLQAARAVWKADPVLAKKLAAHARSTGTWWISSSPALPLPYQLVARIFGFGASERLAAFKRSMAVPESGNAGNT